MTDPTPPAPFTPSPGLFGRVKDILLKPAETWDVIDGEADDIKSIYTRYVVPLAAIAPLATLVHALVFGYSLFGVSYRPSIASALGTAIVSFVLALVSPFVLSLVIDALAPSFDGTKNKLKAFQVAAYASTAGWVAGIFNLVPGLEMLVILGFYSFYLYWLGLPKLMKVPEAKAIGYVVIVLVASVVVFLIIGSVVAPIMALGGGGGSTITIPGS